LEWKASQKSFFKDGKLSLLERKCLDLWSGNKIVWVIGIRQDERFRVESKTQNIKK
jgi:tRNA(Ile)-lysidine synthase